MPITQSKVSQDFKEQENVINALNALKSSSFFTYMPEVVKKIEDLSKEVEEYKIKTPKRKLLDGKILKEKELNKLIVEATGTKKWVLYNENDDLTEELKSIKNHYNVDFDEKKVKRYRFVRNVKDRTSLFFIQIDVLPGYFDVTLATDKVTYSLDGLVNQEELFEELKRESE